MAAGGRDVGMKDTDATDRITRRRSDELAAFYSSAAADGGRDAKEREASMLFSVAEAHVDEDEDYAAALKAAEEALALFREIKNTRGVADTVRLVVHAHSGRSEEYRWTERGDPATNLAGQAEQEAERLVEKELEAFRHAGDERGQACMLLSLAEICWFKRDRVKRSSSFDWATDAHSMFQRLGDKKFEAIAKQALACISLQKYDAADASKLSEEARGLLRGLGETKEEAVALHLLACAQLMDEKWSLGMATAHEALRLFRSIGLDKYAGFELYCIAHWLVQQDKARDALPMAREAQAIFQKLGLGKGWQAGAASLLLQAHISKGDKSAAMKTAKDELERFQASGDRRSEITAHLGIVKAHLIRESPAEAMRELENALEICHELNDRRWQACMLVNSCPLHIDNKDFEKAVSAAEEAQGIFRELDDKSQEARAVQELHRVHVAKKDFRMAAKAAAERRLLYKEEGDKRTEAQVILDYACALGNDGKVEEALAAATESQGMFLDMNCKRGEGSAWQFITKLHLRNSMHDLALQAAEKMQALFEECEDPKQQARGLEALTEVHLAREDYEQAVKTANQARNTAKKSENRTLEVLMLICLTNANTEFLTEKMREAQSSGKELGRAIFDKMLKPAKDAVLLAKKTGSSALTASAVFALGQIFCVSDRRGDALKAAADCGHLWKSVGDSEGEVAAVLLSAEILYCNNELAESSEAASRALEMAQVISDGMQAAQAQDMIKKIQKLQAGGVARPAAVADAAIEGAPAAAGLSAAEPAGKKGLDEVVVAAMVKGTLLASIGSDEAVDMDVPLMEAGMDSLSMVAFRNTLQRESGISMPASTMFDYPTMRGLTDHLVEQSQQ